MASNGGWWGDILGQFSRLIMEGELNKDRVHWRAFPFIRVAVVLTLGIVLADELSYGQSKLILPVVVAMVLITAVHGSQNAISTWMSIWFLGFFLGLSKDIRLSPWHYSKQWNGSQWVVGKVAGQVGSNYMISLSALMEEDLKKGKRICGRIFVSNRPISDNMELSVGQKILFKGRYTELPPSNRGGSFDFSNWLKRKGVHYEGNLEQFISIGRPTLIQRWKRNLWNRFEQYFTDREVLSLLSALVLGDKLLLTQEMKDQYSGAGAMHLLAVSGLHVGMVYLIFSQLLRLIPGGVFQRPIYKFGLLTIIIWIYAGITGGAASVRRAATMFTWMALSKWSGERINIYNSIAGSAFFLLCFNPNLLWDVGFQLSYAAVLGIVYFYPILTKWVDDKGVVPQYFWSLLAVGGAAQISTLPLTMYYFNQFPTYFWLSGCFAVPLTGVILVLSILFMLLSFVAPIGKGLAWILTALVEFMNWGIQVISSLPWSQITDLHPNIFQVGAMLMMVLLLAVYLFFKNKATIFLLLVGLLIWNLGDGWWVWRQTTKISFIIPYRYKRNRLEIKRGGQTFIWGYDEMDKKAAQAKSNIRYMTIGKTIQMEDRDSTSVSWSERGILLDHKILITHIKEWDWERLGENKLKQIYFSGYLDRKQEQKFLEHCACAGISCTVLRGSSLIKWSKD